MISCHMSPFSLGELWTLNGFECESNAKDSDNGPMISGASRWPLPWCDLLKGSGAYQDCFSQKK